MKKENLLGPKLYPSHEKQIFMHCFRNVARTGDTAGFSLGFLGLENTLSLILNVGLIGR